MMIKGKIDWRHKRDRPIWHGGHGDVRLSFETTLIDGKLDNPWHPLFWAA